MGKAFILASIPMLILMVAVEGSVHVPSLFWLDRYEPDYWLWQASILLLGLLCYAMCLSVAYRVSIKQFEKVDL